MEEAARRMADLRVFKGRFPPRRRDHPPAAAVVPLGFATIGDARSEMDRPPRRSAPPTPIAPITSSPSLIVNPPAPNDHVLRGLKPLVAMLPK